MFADDESHPIPAVGNLDMVAQQRTGGAMLVIVIATPLRADERSQRRLLQKFENYLGFINSPDFESEFGAPHPSTVTIRVRIDKDSDAEVFELLRRCEPFVLENNASMEVEAIDHSNRS